jgi:hypothetical protein
LHVTLVEAAMVIIAVSSSRMDLPMVDAVHMVLILVANRVVLL